MSEVIDFNVAIPFGAGAAPVDVMQQDPPGGPFEVEILDVRQVTKEDNGKTSFRFNVAITEEGVAKGITTMVVIGCDWSKRFNLGHVSNLCIGMGMNPAKLVGNIPVTPALFKGKKAFIFVTAPAAGEIDEETGKAARANKNFITRAMYETAKKAAALSGGQAPAAAAQPKKQAPATQAQQAPAVQTQAPAADAAPLGDMFS